MALATNGTDTYAIMNYEQLGEDASHIGMNELGCRVRNFISPANSADALIKGSNTGVRGRYVFSLTDKECFNTGVMYAYGRQANDRQISTFSSTSFTLPSLTGDWAFFSRQIPNTVLRVYTRGVLYIGSSFFFPPSSRFTYIAPYFRSFSGQLNLFYRETTNQILLNEISATIRRTNNSYTSFEARHAFIITFLSNSLRFQLALATNSTETYAIMNYEQLGDDASHIGMNEVACGGARNFISAVNSADTLIKGSNTGVRGRHVFSLTNKDCFKPVVGLRILPSSFFFISSLFTTTSDTLRILQPNETGDVRLHLTDLITNGEVPFSTMLVGQSKTDPSSYRVRYALFRSVARPNSIFIRLQNLFVLKGTPKTKTFQYGALNISRFESERVCSFIQFETEMVNIPTVKVTAHLRGSSPENFAFIWMQNVSTSGFNICAREIVTFGGQRGIIVNYVASSETDDTISERAKVKLLDAQETNCQIRKLRNIYLNNPNVFVSSENHNGMDTVTSWIKRVSLSEVEICAKSTGKAPLTVHILVSGEVSPCTNFSCPTHLECRVIGNRQPVCDCIRSCSGKEGRGEFCGSDYQTYSSLCSLDQTHCFRNGNESVTNVTVRHYGKCQLRSFQAGKSALKSIPELPGVFCKYVNIDESNFIPTSISPLTVFLSVSWDQANFTTPNDASASWSEDVTIRGFKACVLVAGRHPNSDFRALPVIHWTVLQREFLQQQRSNRVTAGRVALATWYTGTQCRTISTSFSQIPNLITSIEHTKPKNYQNAMTVWMETTVISRFVFQVRVCARELQNFDGKHEGIIVHWMRTEAGDTNLISPFIPEQISVTFPAKPVVIGQPNPAECKTVPYNLKFPSLPNPTVLVGGINRNTNIGSSQTTSFSQHDFAVWLEQATSTEVTVCMKSLNTISNQRPLTDANIVVVATLCDSGDRYFNGSCYKKLPGCKSWSNADASCFTEGGSLPSIFNEDESVFFQEFSSTTTWLNLRRIPQTTGQWQWGDGSSLFFNKWFPGQPMTARSDNDCAVAEQRGIENGWKAENCQSCQNAICQIDADLEGRSCSQSCMNGGNCSIESTRIVCRCPPGFIGERCQTNIDEVEGCFNYTTHTEPWRNINSNITGVQPNTTSCDTRTFRNGWHRFAGAAGTRLHTACPASRNKCGTESPGWLDVRGGGTTSTPIELGSVRNATLHFRTFYCADDFGSVLIRNCGAFFTYRFTGFPYWSCDYGICTV